MPSALFTAHVVVQVAFQTALLEMKITYLTDILSSVIMDTKSHVDKRMAQTYEELQVFMLQFLVVRCQVADDIECRVRWERSWDIRL